MKRIITLVLLAIMTVNIVACDKSFRGGGKNLPAAEPTADSMQEGSRFSQNSKYSLDKIKLSDTERSWVCPDEKYKALLKSYNGSTVTGAIVVATDKDVVYLYAEDALEKDGKTKVSQDTVFDLASVSKVFTAVAILQLQENDKLSIEDTLDKYFPEYETGKKITIYNLLHMNSGIPDYLNNPNSFWNISGEDAANKQISDILLDKTTDEELLQALYKVPLDFEPGSEYAYSNTNYRLLAFIIEKLSGMKLSDYLKKNIFDKCGMKKTTSMATGDMTYVPADFEELVKNGFSDKDGYPACPNNSRGEGGIHSCLTDMVAFDRALFGGKLLSQKSMEILLKDENGYCCGLTKNKNGYSHGGSSLTCETFNQITESEEFGHVYVISLERTGVMPQMSGKELLKGTRYIIIMLVFVFFGVFILLLKKKESYTKNIILLVFASVKIVEVIRFILFSWTCR